MTILRVLFARLRSLLRHRRAEQDLDAELRSYVEERAAAYERRGLTSAEARRAALVELGGMEHVKEQVRDVRVGAALAATVRDIRYGARVFRRLPGYAAVVVLTMGVGIGINAAVFNVVHAVLWRSLPYPDAGRIVAIEADTRSFASAYSPSDDVFDVRAARPVVTQLAQAEGRSATLTVQGQMERVAAIRATDDLLPLLGASPMALGRALSSATDADGIRVTGVVISHELWQRRFQGDPSIVGRTIAVNDFQVQVVGVVRKDFRVYLPSADRVEEQVDLWLPATFVPSKLYRGATVFGKLAPGVTIDQASAQIGGLASSFAANHPRTHPNGLRLSVTPLADVITRDAKPVLGALAIAVGFVLLIACANVANLMLVRDKARERELAVRRALGATRLRLIRQLVAENTALVAAGGALGLLLAYGATGLLGWLRPVHLPRQGEISVDVIVVLWTGGLTGASALLFGLFSAFAFTRHADGQLLQAGRAGSLMQRSRRLHRALVLSEVALSIVPLVAAGLMLRTFVNLLDAPVGFDSAHVVTARIPLSLDTYSTVERRSTFYQAAIERINALPGVEAASIGGPPPFAPAQTTQRYSRADDGPSTASIGMQQTIMPGYFDVMSIPLRAGRDVSDDDIRQQRRVAIVDERLAARLWQGDAIGRALRIGESKHPLEIVGIAGAIRARDIRDADTPMVYVPSHVYEIDQTLVVRTRAPLSTIGPAVRHTIEALGPGRAIYDIQTLDDIVAASIDDSRFAMLVLSLFAIVSLLLAGVGLYGTLAYLTARRTQEFGVRLALGASSSAIVGLVLREGFVLLGLGMGIGLAGAAGMTRVLSNLLYGVTAFDTITLLGVLVAVGLVATAAIGWPAWRASCVDPVTALRAE